MHFAIVCLFAISAIQAGPLPKLRHRPPRWVKPKLRPIKILQTSQEAFHIPESRRFTLVHLEDPDLNTRKSFDIERDIKDGINNIRIQDNVRFGKNELVKGDKLRLFENDNEIDDNYNNIRSIFGKNDAIHLTKGKKKKHNLLNIVEQLVEDEDAPSDQDGRGVMEVSLGLKRGLRRQGGLPPKLVYDFNELVD